MEKCYNAASVKNESWLQNDLEQIAARKKIETMAMDAVRAAEEKFGNTVIDVSADKCGWDLTSRYPAPASKDEPRREDRRRVQK